MLNRTVVKKIDIFKGLAKDNLQELMPWLERIEVKPMQVIFREGEKPDGLYLLCSGTVAVIKSSSKGHFRLAELAAPSFFGEVSLLIDEHRSTSIKSQSQCLLGKLPADLYHKKLEEQNKTALLISVNLARLVSERLVHADKIIAELTGKIKRMKMGQDYRALNA